MCSVWHEMFKIASISGAPPQTPLSGLTTLSQTLVARGFLPSAIAASRLWRLHFPGLGRALIRGDCFHHSRRVDATVLKDQLAYSMRTKVK